VHPPEQFDDTHYYDEFDRWGEHVVEGSWDAELVAELDVRDEDHIVEKHTYDAFYQTDLEGYLDTHGIDDLLICGTLANVCVLHTAGSSGLRDYRPVVVEDALGYITEDHREYAVERRLAVRRDGDSRVDRVRIGLRTGRSTPLSAA